MVHIFLGFLVTATTTQHHREGQNKKQDEGEGMVSTVPKKRRTKQKTRQHNRRTNKQTSGQRGEEKMRENEPKRLRVIPYLDLEAGI